MKKVIRNYVVEAVKNVKNSMNHLTAQNSDAEVQPGQKRKRDDELSLASVEQKDEQGPCLELVQVDHPSTSSGRGTMVTSNVVLYSCEEVETMKTKKKHLLALKSDVETTIEHAEIQPGKQRKKEVELWLNRVEQMKTELKIIEDELEEQGLCKKLKNQIVSKTGEVEELTRQGKLLGELVLDDHPSTRLAMIETSLVGSRSAENIEMILNWLKEDGVSAVGVHGMGGVGKTTLLKTIHNRLLEDSGIKGQVYWVTASRDCSLQKLQAAIGKCLGLNIAEEDDERRKSLIFHRLRQLQKSVLIIDDMWNHYATDEIGIPLGSCKIVITTRSLEVCQKVRCQKVIKVVPLLSEDAWSLFVEKSGVVPNKFVAIARGIVEQCAGLPLALITMGSCMRGVTDVHQWENTLFELKKPARRQDHDMDYEVFRILQFSYESLKEERMKQCFLSCILFPEDLNIRRDDLIELWITEGLWDDIEGWENKVNKGHTILNRLESSSLLELTTISWSKENKERIVRMHDLIRDMALIVAQDCVPCMAKVRLLLNKVPVQKKWTIDLVKVSLSHNIIDKIPCEMSPEIPKLRVLILSHNPLKEIPESFFVHMKALRVLDLSWTEIERLPDTVSDLENLRGLFFAGCGCLRYVPSVAKLTKLMALDLNREYSLEQGVEGLGRLNCLEKLYYYSPWNMLDVPGFNNLMVYGLLKVYNIVLGSPETSYYDYKKEVMICGQGDINPVLPSTLQSLIIKNNSLEGQRSLEEAFPSLRQATDLMKLELSDCEGFEYLFISSVVLPHLKRLHLRNLSNLVSILPLQLHLCTSLEVIMIENCPKLESICEGVSEIFEPDHRVSPVNVRKLQLIDLPKLGSSIYPLQLHLMTSLEELEIIDCPKIWGIFTDPSNDTELVFDLPSLKMLYLRGFPGLLSLYPIRLHLCNDLEYLSIVQCPKLEGIFRNPTGVPESILDLSSLEVLYLKGLPNLSSIYRGLLICRRFGRRYSYINIQECPQLQLLSLSNVELICDASPSTVASFPTESEDPEWWQPLHSDYPDVVPLLSNYIHQARQWPPYGGLPLLRKLAAGET